jgi:hypothetical protein
MKFLERRMNYKLSFLIIILVMFFCSFLFLMNYNNRKTEKIFSKGKNIPEEESCEITEEENLNFAEEAETDKETVYTLSQKIRAKSLEGNLENNDSDIIAIAKFFVTGEDFEVELFDNDKNKIKDIALIEDKKLVILNYSGGVYKAVDFVVSSEGKENKTPILDNFSGIKDFNGDGVMEVVAYNFVIYLYNRGEYIVVNTNLEKEIKCDIGETRKCLYNNVNKVVSPDGKKEAWISLNFYEINRPVINIGDIDVKNIEAYYTGEVSAHAYLLDYLRWEDDYNLVFIMGACIAPECSYKIRNLNILTGEIIALKEIHDNHSIDDDDVTEDEIIGIAEETEGIKLKNYDDDLEIIASKYKDKKTEYPNEEERVLENLSNYECSLDMEDELTKNRHLSLSINGIRYTESSNCYNVEECKRLKEEEDKKIEEVLESNVFNDINGCLYKDGKRFIKYNFYAYVNAGFFAFYDFRGKGFGDFVHEWFHFEKGGIRYIFLTGGSGCGGCVGVGPVVKINLKTNEVRFEHYSLPYYYLTAISPDKTKILGVTGDQNESVVKVYDLVKGGESKVIYRVPKDRSIIQFVAGRDLCSGSLTWLDNKNVVVRDYDKDETYGYVKIDDDLVCQGGDGGKHFVID